MKEGDTVATADPHHGRRTGEVIAIWEEDALLFGPVVWVRYPDNSTGHFTLDEVDNLAD